MLDAGQQVAGDALCIDTMSAHGKKGRRMLVNLYRHFGELPRLEVGYDALMRVLDADGVKVERCDILRLWTGLDRMILCMADHPDERLHHAYAVLDG